MGLTPGEFCRREPSVSTPASQVTAAVESLAHFRECLTDPHDFDLEIAALRVALSIPEHPCGDYPAPCNCDDPETHDGAVGYHAERHEAEATASREIRPGSPAALCREKGWGVGTVLYGYATDNEPERVMRITAIGVSSVLGQTLKVGHRVIENPVETNRSFAEREWERA